MLNLQALANTPVQSLVRVPRAMLRRSVSGRMDAGAAATESEQARVSKPVLTVTPLGPRAGVAKTQPDPQDEASLKIERIRAEIRAGTYESQARLDAAADRMLARLTSR